MVAMVTKFGGFYFAVSGVRIFLYFQSNSLKILKLWHIKELMGVYKMVSQNFKILHLTFFKDNFSHFTLKKFTQKFENSETPFCSHPIHYDQ